MAEPTQLSRISAVMLGVRDLASSLAFYKGKLGLKVLMQEPHLALLQCGTVMLGLSPRHASAASQIAGATEVVFAVDSVRAARKNLIELGVIFMSEPRQVTATDWAAHFKDPDGHLLSVFGPEGQV